MEWNELIEKLSQKSSFLLAIDGMCGSGKTTLALALQESLGGHVFHMDDFFLPMELRTVQRLSEPGGNVHYERFLETVLKPLSSQQTVHYQPFDCQTMTLQKAINIPYHPINIIEGSYALHPDLQSYYSDVIVLRISPSLQKERLMKRNPERMDDFLERWIPMENQYFEAFHIFEKYPVYENLHIL